MAVAAQGVCREPTTAERIRSACARARCATLAGDGLEPAATPVHHLMEDGSFAVTVPVGGVLAAKALAADAAGVQAVLELTDYAPLPLREPERSLVWIRGRLQHVPAGEVRDVLDVIAAADPNPALLQVDTGRSAEREDDDDSHSALLRLEIESVVAADATGAEAVALSALLAAAPDPFCAMETPTTATWWTGWRPGCPFHCDGDWSGRSASTGTVSGCGWRTPTATSTCGCRSRVRSTT
ncbi:MAG: prephenate dehydratase [Mycobacterium sp.]|nr:prephenate dehydratase [Mycobacterium sp.]